MLGHLLLERRFTKGQDINKVIAVLHSLVGQQSQPGAKDAPTIFAMLSTEVLLMHCAAALQRLQHFNAACSDRTRACVRLWNETSDRRACAMTRVGDFPPAGKSGKEGNLPPSGGGQLPSPSEEGNFPPAPEEGNFPRSGGG